MNYLCPGVKSGVISQGKLILTGYQGKENQLKSLRLSRTQRADRKIVLQRYGSACRDIKGSSL